MRNYHLHTLPNGIRLVHNPVATSKIVHCGIMLDIGSRDETSANQGIAHFWEHMAFKGTKNRKAFHILNRLEAVGGELNAFTDKEKIFFFATVRQEYFERALELLVDITFHSIFPPDQIERERKVILEEMAMYYDDADGSLHDAFDALLYPGHPMGMNVLGTAQTVGHFTRNHFTDFIKTHFDTSKIVVASVGNISFDVVRALSEKLMASIKKTTMRPARKGKYKFLPKHATEHRPVKQARCAIGRQALSLHDNRRSLLYFVNNILGGPGMNSRLNLTLRERNGLVYSIGSQFVPFTDTGLWVTSFGTEPSQMDKAIELVFKELKNLRVQPPTARALSTAKEQFMGQVAMGEENNGGFMMFMARSILDLNRVPSIDDLLAQIKTITPTQVQETAELLFQEKDLSVLKLLPEADIQRNG